MDSDGWKASLADLGMPLGPPRPPPTAFDAEKARLGVEALRIEDLSPTEREALAAWLAAFKHHWPARFADVLAGIGEATLRRLRPGVDENRYLKLRRIAIENLAGVL